MCENCQYLIIEKVICIWDLFVAGRLVGRQAFEICLFRQAITKKITECSNRLLFDSLIAKLPIRLGEYCRMLNEKQICENIKHLREQRGETLNSLAEKTGLSKGYLSKVENSSKAPPVSTLIVIAKALSATVSDIFDIALEKVPATLVKANERQQVAQSDSAYGYTYERLAYRYPNKKMEPCIYTLALNKRKSDVFSHAGEEMIFVLDGSMRFVHGDRSYLLEEGDCIYFDSSIEHYCISDGKKETRYLAVFCQP